MKSLLEKRILVSATIKKGWEQKPWIGNATLGVIYQKELKRGEEE